MPKQQKKLTFLLAKHKKERKLTKNKRENRRFHAIELRAQGCKLEEIANKLDVKIRTISTWISEFKNKGVSGLKNKKQKGNRRNISLEKEKEFLSKFEEKAEKGQIVTVQEIKKEYIELVGHQIGSGQIYKLLKRHGYRKIMPRSKHPKKASEEAIEASKKLKKV